jgi:uncharacterized SAM-binding protein YcdF (DUF218 family)
MFLLPSVLAMVFIVFGFVLFFFKKKKIGKILIIAGALFYYIFSITIVSDFLLFPLEKEYALLKEQEMNMTDKVVLLLGGKEADVLRGSEVLRISHSTNHRVKIIISGTDPLNPKSEEASAVRGFFISRGVPAENITIEGKSKNTRENTRNVKEIVEDKPFFLVTSAYHMNRSMKEFERLEANPIPAPTDFKRKGQYDFFDFFPDPQNLKKSDLAIREHFGRIYYKILFTFSS